MNTATLDTYESLVDYARSISEGIDERRWSLGDICNVAMHKFGERSVEEIAKDIGQRKSSLYQYAKVSNFYAVDLRKRLQTDLPNITYTYLRDAMRLGDLDTAMEWLNEASMLGYTADEASRKLTERLGHETRESAIGEITDRFFTTKGNFITIHIDDASNWIPGMSVTIRKGK